MGAFYTDGMPVVFGPFGGDCPTPGEQWLAELNRRRREHWKQLHPRRAKWRRWRGKVAKRCSCPSSFHGRGREQFMARARAAESGTLRPRLRGH